MATSAAEGNKERPLSHSRSYQLLPPSMNELRIVLLGNCWTQKSSVANFIVGEKLFNIEEEPDQCLRVTGQLKNHEIVLINSSDLLHPHISENRLRGLVKNCVRHCAPGPHVFLLVLQAEDFTDENNRRLCRVLEKFSFQSFDHSLVLVSEPKEESSAMYMEHPPLKDMIRRCRYRHLNMMNLEHSELLTRLGQIAKENNADHLNCDDSEDEDGGLFMSKIKSEVFTPALNLVLCGRRGSGKTSAAEAILGQAEFPSVSSSPECVKRQGEAGGRRLTLVELPALHGRPLEKVMEESYRCVSLCEPEGVHAFILVIPVGPLTDEDKAEYETIQKMFSSRVTAFTVVLFTAESDPAAQEAFKFVKENKNIQELFQSCGGQFVVLNMKEKQQIPELFDAVEKMRMKGSRSFTKDTFTKVQMEKVSHLQAELQDAENRSVEGLRIVLVGRSGSGKRATANTILGRNHFKPRINPKPATSSCERATGEIDGQPVAVVVTPGLFDRILSDDKIQQDLYKDLGMLSPGPHVFLLVLQIGNFTQEEKDSVELIRRYFGQKSEDFIIIIFTRGDALGSQLFESYVEDCDDFLKELLNQCGGRYQVVNNNDQTNRTQVRELLKKINTMVKENGGCYRTEDFVEIQAKNIMKKKDEGIKRMIDDLKRKHGEELETLRRRIGEERKETERERNLRMKQLQEKEECISKERREAKKEREDEERQRKRLEETKRHEWRQKLEASEKIALSEGAQREAAERKLESYRKEMKRDRDAWDKERKDMWERLRQEDKQSLEEKKTSFQKLQEEYRQKRRKWTWTLSVLSVLLLFLFYFAFLSTHTAESPTRKEHK